MERLQQEQQQVDGSGIFGELTITITNQFIAVTGITVTGYGGVYTIEQMTGLYR